MSSTSRKKGHHGITRDRSFSFRPDDPRRGFELEASKNRKVVESDPNLRLEPHHTIRVDYPGRGPVTVQAIPREVSLVNPRKPDEKPSPVLTVLLINSDLGIHEDVSGFINGQAKRLSTGDERSVLEVGVNEKIIQVLDDISGKPSGLNLTPVPAMGDGERAMLKVSEHEFEPPTKFEPLANQLSPLHGRTELVAEGVIVPPQVKEHTAQHIAALAQHWRQ